MTNKRTFAAMALALTAALPMAAQKYEVTGTAPASAPYVYMQNMQGQAVDSVKVENGTFKFNGEAEGKLFAFIFSDRKGSNATVAVLDGNVKVNLSEGTTTGTPENDGLTKWRNVLHPLNEKMGQLNAEYRSYHSKGQVPDSVMARIEKDYEVLKTDMVAQVKTLCNENKQAKFPAFFLATMGSQLERADVIDLAETGNPAYMQVSILERMRGSIQGWKRQMPGTMFTDLELNDVNGKPHKLSEYIGKGKYVLVDFWASWCGPCRREMPAVKALYEKYHAKGFDIVGLSFDDNAKDWTGAINSMKLPWHHLSDLKGWQSIAGQTYGINAIPATILFGPDGKVVVSGLHSEELETKLAELLK